MIISALFIIQMYMFMSEKVNTIHEIFVLSPCTTYMMYYKSRIDDLTGFHFALGSKKIRR